MARLPRIDIPDYAQHLVLRGNNRAILFHDDVERFVFMHALQRAATTYGSEVHAYVLMSNHVHLLATGRQYGAVSQTMQDIGRRFVRFVNLRRRRTGTLFEGRFKSSVVETDRYFLACMRYIECNPVRAGMVAHPSRFAWSSHNSNLTGEPIAPLTPHPTYMALGIDASERAQAYARLFARPLHEEELAAIRTSARMSRVLGSEGFQAELSQLLKRPAGPTAHGGARQGPRITSKGTDHQVI